MNLAFDHFIRKYYKQLDDRFLQRKVLQFKNIVEFRKSFSLDIFISFFIDGLSAQAINKTMIKRTAMEMSDHGSYKMFPTTVSLDNYIPGISICKVGAMIAQIIRARMRSLFILVSVDILSI